MGHHTYIGPYTSIGDNSTITNSEVENSIIMEGTYIDCGRRARPLNVQKRLFNRKFHYLFGVSGK